MKYRQFWRRAQLGVCPGTGVQHHRRADPGKKLLIVTTNLSLPELTNPDSLAKARIYDRLLERCVPVRIHNRNLRQENVRECLQRVKKLLE